MSLLPYILSEIRGLPTAMDDGPRRSPFYRDDVADLLGDLVHYHPSMLHMLDGQPSSVDGLHRPVVLFPRQLRQQLSAPLRQHLEGKKGAGAQSLAQRNLDKDKYAFAVDVDVHHFRPEELSVQVLKDEGFVVVEGSHEERVDEHGFVRRQFTRRYKLPEGVDPDTVTSQLSSDGVLQVTAPRKEALLGPRRQVQITHTNQPAALDQHGAVGDQDEAKSKEQKTAEEKVKQ